MSNDDSLAPLRSRAYVLADTGRYTDWDAVCVELVSEGEIEILARRLTHDKFFQIMLLNRIRAAQERA